MTDGANSIRWPHSNVSTASSLGVVAHAASMPVVNEGPTVEYLKDGRLILQA